MAHFARLLHNVKAPHPNLHGIIQYNKFYRKALKYIITGNNRHEEQALFTHDAKIIQIPITRRLNYFKYLITTGLSVCDSFKQPFDSIVNKL